MNQDAIYEKLTAIFHDVFDDDSIVVTPELTADDVDEWDSLSHIRLVLAVEKKFGLKFSAAEVGRLKNVGEFVALISSRATVA
ncbi:acyl carrier protein [Rhizobacter sp. LjRoot28]|jgi:acyl carrier protein|uniref:acyl carrier protein n=1 Tax=Rhizobacter sp. LjRoot28 TaxID=3342309 RepID=UPI003ECE8D4C